uniref:GG17437 n=1 Tax=Drosophila erecta TaxID=7220 RepID=B3P4V5_DROER
MDQDHLKNAKKATRRVGRLRSLGIVTVGAAALMAGMTAYKQQDQLFPDLRDASSATSSGGNQSSTGCAGVQVPPVPGFTVP